MELASQAYDGEQVKRWSRAIRSVRLRDFSVRSAVRFESGPIHKANTQHERRFIALLLMVLAECRKGPLDVRAWTRWLWRGRRDRQYISAEGEIKRRYVPAVGADGKSGRQGGLAARLGVSVKEVDRYLDVAIAAGFLNVWQRKRKDEVPAKFKGKEYPYAIFRWLGTIPAHCLRRLRGAPAEDHTEPARADEPGPSRRGSAESVSFYERMNRRLLGPFPAPD